MASAASIVEGAGFTIAEAGGTAMRLAPRRPLRPGLYDFEIVATRIRNKLYHFGTQGHFSACLGGINIAVYDAIGVVPAFA